MDPITLILRAIKGSPLTHAEEDGNKTALKTAIEQAYAEAAKTADFVEVTATKTDPVDADTFFMFNSEAGGVPVIVSKADFLAAVVSALAGKQATLVSGTNVKTINGTSILGSGNIAIAGGTGDIATISHNGAGADPVTGDTLSVTFATGWTGSVQWTRNGSNISGATSATYEAVEADEGATIAAVISGLTYAPVGLEVAAPSATVPDAFTSGDWTATAGVESIVLNITALPSDGGSAITALQYRLDGGSPVTLSGTGTGERTISSLTGGVEYDVEIRAVNAVGNGAWSDLKARTPTAASSGAEIVAVGRSDTSFGTSGNIPVPAGAEPGDRLVVFLSKNTGAAVTSINDNQSTGYTELTTTGQGSDDKQYVSAPLGSTVPTTITVNFDANDIVSPAVVFVVRGASATVANQGALSTGFAAGPRAHNYTTTGANEFVFGQLDFGSGGITGATDEDGDHTWSLATGNGYNTYFAIVRPTAGSYSATVGPAGGSDASGGNWFSLEAE